MTAQENFPLSHCSSQTHFRFTATDIVVIEPHKPDIILKKPPDKYVIQYANQYANHHSTAGRDSGCLYKRTALSFSVSILISFNTPGRDSTSTSKSKSKPHLRQDTLTPQPTQTVSSSTPDEPSTRANDQARPSPACAPSTLPATPGASPSTTTAPWRDANRAGKRAAR